MENKNEILKELEEFKKERVNFEKSIEINKKKFASKIRNGMGEKIKKSYSKPQKIKLSKITRLKRWLKKYL